MFDLKTAALGTTALDAAHLRPTTEERIRLLQAMQDTAPTEVKEPVTTLTSMWREIQSTFAGANYQVDSPAGRLAGSAELATFKKYGYPAVLTPIILYSRKTCSVDLDSKT